MLRRRKKKKKNGEGRKTERERKKKAAERIQQCFWVSILFYVDRKQEGPRGVSFGVKSLN
jgi:hypothetical protein